MLRAGHVASEALTLSSVHAGQNPMDTVSIMGAEGGGADGGDGGRRRGCVGGHVCGVGFEGGPLAGATSKGVAPSDGVPRGARAVRVRYARAGDLLSTSGEGSTKCRAGKGEKPPAAAGAQSPPVDPYAARVSLPPSVARASAVVAALPGAVLLDGAGQAGPVPKGGEPSAECDGGSDSAHA